jgi:hypothetical protein
MAIFRPKPSQIFLFCLVPKSPIHIGLINVQKVEELLALEADLATEWAAASSIEYLQNFERQVTPDVFFENLVEDCKISLITLQNRIKSAANRYRKAWTTELAALKKAGTYGDNVERINHLESKLNEASERYVSERLGNYVKTELLNSEKMTQKFLKIAESSLKTDLSVSRTVPCSQGTVIGTGIL